MVTNGVFLVMTGRRCASDHATMALLYHRMGSDWLVCSLGEEGSPGDRSA
jgi:hypothetical protein